MRIDQNHQRSYVTMNAAHFYSSWLRNSDEKKNNVIRGRHAKCATFSFAASYFTVLTFHRCHWEFGLNRHFRSVLWLGICGRGVIMPLLTIAIGIDIDNLS